MSKPHLVFHRCNQNIYETDEDWFFPHEALLLLNLLTLSLIWIDFIGCAPWLVKVSSIDVIFDENMLTLLRNLYTTPNPLPDTLFSNSCFSLDTYNGFEINVYDGPNGTDFSSVDGVGVRTDDTLAGCKSDELATGVAKIETKI